MYGIIESDEAIVHTFDSHDQPGRIALYVIPGGENRRAERVRVRLTQDEARLLRRQLLVAIREAQVREQEQA